MSVQKIIARLINKKNIKNLSESSKFLRITTDTIFIDYVKGSYFKLSKEDTVWEF